VQHFIVNKNGSGNKGVVELWSWAFQSGATRPGSIINYAVGSVYGYYEVSYTPRSLSRDIDRPFFLVQYRLKKTFELRFHIDIMV
jgi:hypothetical protein